MKTITKAIACLLLVACSAAQQNNAKTITDTAGNVCEVVVTVVDPVLAPLCTTAQDVALAIEALVEQQQAAADAGAAGHGRKVAVAPRKPTSAEVYAWLVAHGAKTVKTSSL